MLKHHILSLLLLLGFSHGHPNQDAPNTALNPSLKDFPQRRGLVDKYVVVLEDDAQINQFVKTLSDTIGNAIGYKYTHALKGFSGTFTASELAILRALPAVKYIEKDNEVHAHVKQANSTYGLAITSQRFLLLPAQQNTYFYKPSKGSVDVYVVDSGIDTTHPDFNGRATFGQDFTDEGFFDGTGHGTHVAGTIGSKTYGVFKNAHLIAVKVLDSSGRATTSAVIAGIDWVVQHKNGPSVMNLSLGITGNYSSINDAVRGAHDAGVTAVVSAGNSGDSGLGACDQSPALEPTAITVGAIDNTYTCPSFSSEDSCVDIHAAGVRVLSTYPGGRTKLMNGTSMSAPHVSGVAAYLIDQFGRSKPAQVRAMIIKYASKGLVKNRRGAPNVLANNGFFKS